MNIVVLNGSPKGKYSITLHTVLYIEKYAQDNIKDNNYNFEILNVGQHIKSIEKNNADTIASIKKADLLLFSYPVYTFIAPSQLHYFIQILKEWDIDLSTKYAAQITTSKHFYDVTAHKYIEQNCADLKLKYIGGLSADMDDLLTKKGQEEAKSFWNFICFSMKNDNYKVEPEHPKSILPKIPQLKSFYKKHFTQIEHDNKYNVVIVTNCSTDDKNLTNMISDFCDVFKYKTKIVNISQFPFSGGCLGCFNCAVTGTCVHKDKFDQFLRNEIQQADAAITAFTIRDHSMGADFKRYDDRQFCNGHRTVTMGTPDGYIISGNYSQEANLNMIIEGRSEVGHHYFCGVATDENGKDKATSIEISKLAQRLEFALETKISQPMNFFGIGGMKIFRDLIYLMRGLMKADHKFYKEHNFYDFPQKKKGTLIKIMLLGALVNSPVVKNKLGNKMNEGMVAPYEKVIASVSKKD